MKKFFSWFSYKKVAVVLIQCTLPYENTVMTFTQKCKLYENKYGQRRINMSLDYYPLASIRNKELLTRFLNRQCSVPIPSYAQVVNGTPPLVLEDVASFYF